MAIVSKAYLVWLDTFGTCLDPRRRPRFHSNHPVWLGLAEACHTTTTHICVKSKKRVLRMSVTCLCAARSFVCKCVCVRGKGQIRTCKSVRVRVCVFTYLWGQSEPDTSETGYLEEDINSEPQEQLWTSWHASLRHLANCEERFLSGLTYWIFGQ